MAYVDENLNDPTLYFEPLIWTGNGSTPRSLSGLDFQPHMVWSKRRDDAAGHNVLDSVRGAGVDSEICPSSNGAEGSNNANTYGYLSAFTSDGFTVTEGSSDNAYWNNNTATYVAWCWKAGGSGSSNTDGSINTIKTSANTTSGFSINTFTGTQNVGTVGHGLGSAPGVMIVKNTADSSDAWYVYHQGLASDPETDYIILNTTAAKVDYNTPWNDTAPTSSVFTVGADGGNNESGSTMAAYCFAEKQGFSKFGSYTGNGSSSANSGPFVYLGFKPSLVIVKNTSGTEGWQIWDNKRSSFNGQGSNISPNSANAESTGVRVHFFSNGFQLVSSGADQNTDGNVFIYMAFAEAPFVNSNGVPCNAR